MELSQSIDINLEDGSTISLNVTPQFMTSVRQCAGLAPDETLSDIHVKQFLISALQNFLEHSADEIEST